jgi:hypothetical protein
MPRLTAGRHACKGRGPPAATGAREYLAISAAPARRRDRHDPRRTFVVLAQRFGYRSRWSKTRSGIALARGPGWQASTRATAMRIGCASWRKRCRSTHCAGRVDLATHANSCDAMPRSRPSSRNCSGLMSGHYFRLGAALLAGRGCLDRLIAGLGCVGHRLYIAGWGRAGRGC